MTGEAWVRQTLSAIFSAGLTEGDVSAPRLAQRLGLGEDEMASRLDKLEKEELVSRRGSRLWLTPKGRGLLKVVFIGGGFEILHPGHLYTIKRARKLGDCLVVVLARDSTIRKNKSRDPVASEEERVELASSMRDVDAAILGVERDIYATLERVRPDVVALGYDQRHSESEIEAEAAKRGMKLQVVRLGSPKPAVKTTKLLRGL
ncbi:MAG TPA: adenylyltransferase/cytidyltransferase family protein [Nitrososphaerales archaeon]|nr:adenylyltransferase/cytidyltransferase family protein [Nitrososphaerales archaeon]